MSARSVPAVVWDLADRSLLPGSIQAGGQLEAAGQWQAVAYGVIRLLPAQ